METRKILLKRFLAQKIASTIFIILAILSFIFLASEGDITIWFFPLKLLSLIGMLFFGWLGSELDDAAHMTNRQWIRNKKEMIEISERVFRS